MRWTPEHDKRLIAFREQYPDSFSQVGKAMSLWFETQISADACQKRHQLLTPPPKLATFPVHDPMPYFHAHFTNVGSPRSVVPKIPWYEDYTDASLYQTATKLLHISDLHVPLHDDRLLDRALTEHSDADIVIVAGDALEIYGFSRFKKRRNLPIEQEIEAWMRIQEHLAQTFPHVIIIDSNHLDRVSQQFDQIPMGLNFLVERNIMRYLAQPFANVHVVDDWWFQIGDAIFTHGDYSGGKAPKSARKVFDWFDNRIRTGLLDAAYPRVVVQAHTHQVGTSYERGVKLIESGCLARLPLEYTMDQRSVAFANAQQNGYVVVVQKRGRTVLNESREYLLEREENLVESCG